MKIVGILYIVGLVKFIKSRDDIFLSRGECRPTLGAICHGRISTVPGTIVYWAGTPALEGFEGQ